MKYTRIAIVDLKTIEQCDNAIDSIENDYQNVVGGFSAWNSGYASDLLSGATKKIEAIQRKSDKLFTKWTKERFVEYKKQNPSDAITFEEYEEKEMYC
ncbi:MAG: hypothetical protein GY928_06490 [Colwellia sp.]|nr:hypothetical protein [Colwellia sp.]